MAAMITATHSFLLNNMAGWMTSGRQQEDACVDVDFELSIKHTACYVRIFGLRHLDISFRSVISPLSVIFMRPGPSVRCPSLLYDGVKGHTWFKETGASASSKIRRNGICFLTCVINIVIHNFIHLYQTIL